MGNISKMCHKKDYMCRLSLASDLLRLIYAFKLKDAYLDLTTYQKIFRTLPLSVASNQRIFSMLKLVKIYGRNLRVYLLKEELIISNNDLNFFNVEHEITRKLAYDDIIKTFCSNESLSN